MRSHALSSQRVRCNDAVESGAHTYVFVFAALSRFLLTVGGMRAMHDVDAEHEVGEAGQFFVQRRRRARPWALTDRYA